MANLLGGTRIYGTGTVDTILYVNGTTVATNTTSGALQVDGGAGIVGNIHVGGTANFTGTVVTTGALIVNGATTHNAAVTVNSAVTIVNNNLTAATLTGRLTVTAVNSATTTTPQTIDSGVVFDHKTNTAESLADGGTYFGEMTFRKYGAGVDFSGGPAFQLGFTENGNIWQRSGTGVTWNSWKKLIDTTNSTATSIGFQSMAVGTSTTGLVSGEIRATNEITAYYGSDINLKENVQTIEHALEKLNQIRGVMFDWTDDYISKKGGEDGYFVRKHDTGIIAQDVEIVLPEVVATRNDGTKAVKYEKMIGLIIQSINELSAEVQEIKKRLS
jgi:hypothetical protein